MRVVLIHNPDAGDASTPSMQQVEALIRDAGHDVACYSSKGRKWKAALEDTLDIVAIAGGDGTVAKVARRTIGRRVPLAILPLGTANNVARSLDGADLPLEARIRSWDCARRKRIDAGIVRGPWKRRHFIEGAGVGLFALTMLEARRDRTLQHLDDSGARAVYAQRLLREQLKQCRATPLKAKLDGRDVSGDYLLFEAMNLEFLGPNLCLAPRSTGTDGLLDVVLITEENRQALDDYLGGWHEGCEFPTQFTTLKGVQLEFEWTGFDLHIDDTVYPKKKTGARAPARITFDVVPGALEFLL